MHGPFDPQPRRNMTPEPRREIVRNEVRQKQDRIEPVEGLTWRSVGRIILIVVFLALVGILFVRFGRAL